MQTLLQTQLNTLMDNKEPEGDDSWTTKSRQQKTSPCEIFQESKAEKR